MCSLNYPSTLFGEEASRRKRGWEEGGKGNIFKSRGCNSPASLSLPPPWRMRWSRAKPALPTLDMTKKKTPCNDVDDSITPLACIVAWHKWTGAFLLLPIKTETWNAWCIKWWLARKGPSTLAFFASVFVSVFPSVIAPLHLLGRNRRSHGR
jgi:hypothetical protein